MPLREFTCEKCGHAFEFLVRSQEETIKCPQCGSSELKKKFSKIATPAKQGGSATKSCCSSGSCGSCSGC